MSRPFVIDKNRDTTVNVFMITATKIGNLAFLTACMTLAFSACSNKEKEDNNRPPEQGTDQPTEQGSATTNASEKSQTLQDTAKQKSQEVVQKANDYADKKMAQANEEIRTKTEYINENKDKLLSLFASTDDSASEQVLTDEETSIEWKDMEGVVSDGLKDTVMTTVKSAVNKLGSKNGFLNNPDVRIGMPDSLDRVSEVLQQVGRGDLVDNFKTSINRAAEKAVRASPDIFINAASEITLKDVKTIWKGEGSPLTDYFRRTSKDELVNTMKPVIARATESTGVTRRYKSMTSAIPENKSLMSGINQVSESLGLKGSQENINLDLDKYILGETLDGLFKTMAQEEAKIRKNPKEYGSGLVKSLFEAVSKPQNQ